MQVKTWMMRLTSTTQCSTWPERVNGTLSTMNNGFGRREGLARILPCTYT